MPFKYFAGIDPGFTGALAVLSEDGLIARIHDMPVINTGFNRIDLTTLYDVLKHLPVNTHVALENPTTRPGEGAERCFRFGRGIGNIEAMLHVSGLRYVLIPPQTWTAYLGVVGKSHDHDCRQRLAYFQGLYPQHESKVIGSRGGVLDGPLDALLIAEYLRRITLSPVGKMGGKRPPKFIGRMEDGSPIT